MIIKYEIACKEAGLSEEQTAEIRKFFDAGKKKVKRLKDAKERYDFGYLSLEGMTEEYNDYGIYSYDIADSSSDPATTIVEKMDLELLEKCMTELEEEDRKFLLLCFEGDRGILAKLSKEMGIPESTLSARKKRLFEKVKKSFLKNY
mgnify:CR=1 FL=1